MSRVRRRTLSHTEIEDFLNEISHVNVPKPIEETTTINLQEPINVSPVKEVDLIRQFCKVIPNSF